MTSIRVIAREGASVAAAAQPCTYEVHYIPPEYPTKLFPSRCRHEPQFVMAAHLELTRPRRGPRLELDHVMCLACGTSRPSTHGGNVLVDATMLLAEVGPNHWRFAQRISEIRNRWGRIATHLFGPKGWNGRHERVARLIDPKLTMRLFVKPAKHRRHVRMGRITFDPSYMRETT